ncbi:MAG: Gfo/Idh/MocA family oxidoreductase [Pirellulaceae bacterium]
MSLDRRHFLSSTAAASTLLAPAIHAASKTKQYRTALIGTGWWGMNILREAAWRLARLRSLRLCDVDSDRLEIAAEEVQDICGDQPRTYGDFRELFEKESVEIAIIATPDHWHALNALAAIEAGGSPLYRKTYRPYYR